MITKEQWNNLDYNQKRELLHNLDLINENNYFTWFLTYEDLKKELNFI